MLPTSGSAVSKNKNIWIHTHREREREREREKRVQKKRNKSDNLLWKRNDVWWLWKFKLSGPLNNIRFGICNGVWAEVRTAMRMEREREEEVGGGGFLFWEIEHGKLSIEEMDSAAISPVKRRGERESSFPPPPPLHPPPTVSISPSFEPVTFPSCKLKRISSSFPFFSISPLIKLKRGSCEMIACPILQHWNIQTFLARTWHLKHKHGDPAWNGKHK